MLDWNLLLNSVRRKSLSGSSESMNTGVGRQELERDYDRILFATPTRRLANKTQVFPMEENVAIRNRLTHSHEVSNLARSIGVRIALQHADEVFGDDHAKLMVTRNVPSLLAAVGLAHDLGNPPFGHQGEVAMREWFTTRNKESKPIHNDSLYFDGNPQTFRLLTRLQVLNDEFGLNLTVATLSAIMKYPCLYSSESRCKFRKFGIFESEKEIAEEVWEATGLSEGIRHPFAYIMEACDDIAYSVIDAEDTVKKGYASFYDLMDFLESSSQNDDVISETVSASRTKNTEFKEASLSSRELNDISMQMFRVKAISVMIVAATETFIGNIGRILNGTLSSNFELIKDSNCAALCKALKEFDRRHGFQHSDIFRLELMGNNYIKETMDLLWDPISKSPGDRNAFERYAYGTISENYRRVYEQSNMRRYHAQRLLCDAVSGMTEPYLMGVCEELRGLRDGHSS